MHRPRLLISPLALAAAVAVAVLLRSITVSSGQGPVMLTVKTGEWYYDPKEITVAPSAVVSLTLEHVGSTSIPHDIVFELADGTKAASKRIRGGEKDVLGFTAPAAVGSYVFYCSVGNHRSRGMEGTLIITGDGGTVLPSPEATDMGTRLPPSGKTPTITVSPRALYMPWAEQDRYQPPIISPTLTTPFPVSPFCPEPRQQCRPCPGCTMTPVPGAGTPTVCPDCRRR